MDNVPLSDVAERKNETYGTGDVNEMMYKVENAPTESSRRSNKVSTAMTTLGHILIATFCVYIIYLSFRDFTLFSLHPTLMSVGTLFLMAEAIMALSEGNILTGRLSRPSRTRMHWILQAVAAAFIFIGFLIIVINKNKNDKPHFQTWHSIFGLITVISVAGASAGGVTALYSIQLKDFFKPAIIKLIHNLAGIGTFTFGTVSLILAMYSHWFQTRTNGDIQVCCIILICVSAIFTLINPSKSAVSRFQMLRTN